MGHEVIIPILGLTFPKTTKLLLVAIRPFTRHGLGRFLSKTYWNIEKDLGGLILMHYIWSCHEMLAA